MTEKTVSKVLISLDQDASDIIDFFSEKAMSKSGTVCLALKEFYTLYTQKSLNHGEQVIDENGKLSSLDALAASPRKVDERERMVRAPIGDESGASEDITLEEA